MPMIIKANEIKKRSRAGMKNPLRGIYVGEDYDLLAAIMARYPSGVATLETALSLHGITDEYLNPPFFLSFNLGYRPIKDERIVQIWEDRNTRALGTIAMERDGVEFLTYDKERLLLEVFRREKLIKLFYFLLDVDPREKDLALLNSNCRSESVSYACRIPSCICLISADLLKDLR